MMVMDVVGFEPEYELIGEGGLITWFVAEGHEARGLKIEMDDRVPTAWSVVDSKKKVLHREVING